MDTPSTATSDQLTALVGIEATAQLIKLYGGMSLYVCGPDRMNRDHPITQQIGQQSAQQLAAMYGGTSLKVPAQVTVH